MPVSLILNKVDLVTNKKKLRSLQAELEDLCPFEDVFHISCESGYGLENLQDYLVSSAV